MPKPVTITFLGGLSDIGRNCAALEADGEILILDCGVLFANETQPGVDNILPDLDYLFDRADQVIGCVLTHAHEDHIGALSHLLKEIDCPLYGSEFTLGVASRRLAESGITPETIEVKTGDQVEIGPFECEFLSVTHSVPGGHITAIKTSQGNILHSSDFKLDEAPIDNKLTDINRIKEIASIDGIRLLLADSTNSDSEGVSKSESSIKEGLKKAFSRNEGRRIFAACFSSHIHRIQQIVDVAKFSNRKIAVMGLSMKLNIELATRLEILELDEWVDIEAAGGIPDEQLCVVCTGSQAEENSALSKVALGAHRQIQARSNDTVILSANPIPGNEARVYRMLNGFAERGVQVEAGSALGLHTTGHGKRGELEVLHTAANPEWFIPVHGEFRHLEAHRDLALSLGMPDDKVLLCLDGDQVEMTDGGLKLRTFVTSGKYLFISGKLMSDDLDVIEDRVSLSKHGAVSVSVNVSNGAPKVVVSSRGLVDEGAADEIHSQIERTIEKSLKNELVKEGVGGSKERGSPASQRESAASNKRGRKGKKGKTDKNLAQQKNKQKIKHDKKNSSEFVDNPERLEKLIKRAVRREVRDTTGLLPIIFIDIS